MTSQIQAGNDALIAEAVKNVMSGATRTSTKWLKPTGVVNVYKVGREVHVMANYTYWHATGTAQKDGTIAWDDQAPQAGVSHHRLGR